MSNIKVCIIGVGNCSSALVQGVNFYSQTNAEFSGIAYKNIGGYKPTDIEFVGAIDCDVRKVGLKLSEAIFKEPNCARVFQTDCTHKGDPVVINGILADGMSEYMFNQPERHGFRSTDKDYDESEIIELFKQSDVILNYLPVGSQMATEIYAKLAIEAKTPFINNIPVLSLNHPDWEEKFIDAEIPYIGSDIKSQFGSSIISQIVQELAFSRGMTVDFHQQINVGGNTDFNNMMDKSRLKHKKISKENVIRAQNELNDVVLDDDALFAGPSTFIPYLKDNKVAYFNVRMRGFGGAPVEMDIKLSVQDSENSAGVVIDAIRFLKVAHELGIRGCLRGPSAFTQKSPPKQLDFDTAKHECDSLAVRILTRNTVRQTENKSAKEFAWEEFNSGGMSYLDKIEND